MLNKYKFDYSKFAFELIKINDLDKEIKENKENELLHKLIN